jgi:ParB-like chromosome segregation protein Spo0J
MDYNDFKKQEEEKEFQELLQELKTKLSYMSIDEQIAQINKIKIALHEISPFKNEPVDCVLWIKQEEVGANDYNPNKVAPPEMELLKLSIQNDGYTQPIVAWDIDGKKEVIDGFHRSRVGKECEEIKQRIFSYLPIVTINEGQTDKNNRIASTIRHNRARGKHQVEAMSDIVLELKNRNWTNQRICKELGMDEDEVLRLCQITGLEDMFKDEEFSKSWNVEDSEEDASFELFTDEVSNEEKQINFFRTVNTNDENRIFHTFDKWECYKAGFYNNFPPKGITKEQAEIIYRDFLADDNLFRETLGKVITEWKNSCEHYLTNRAMNRIAWLGQASLCYAKGIPACFRGGFYLLSEQQQEKANKTAYEYLTKWLKLNGLEEITFEDAVSVGRQVEIY